MSLCSDKRDILDLVKLSYIIVRTGIGTGQIQVTQFLMNGKPKSISCNMLVI